MLWTSHRKRSCVDAIRACRASAIAIAALLLNPSDSRADVPNFNGPFPLREALTFYIVNQTGEEFSIGIRWRDEYQSRMDRPVMIRVFDPDEHEMARHDDEGLQVQGPPPQRAVDLRVGAHGAGVYQLAVNGFGGEFDVHTTPPLPFGLFGSPALAGRTNQFATAYIDLPPKLDSAPVRCTGVLEQVRLEDEEGHVKIELHGENPSGQVRLPASGRHVWTLSVKAAGEYSLDFGGLPIILCPDPVSARAIHSSVDVLDDGTICFHKFQVRAHEILKRYRSMAPSAFEVQPPQLVRYKRQWLAQPARNQLLLGQYGVYSGLWPTLREQNLDQTSPWFGSIFIWRDAKGRTRTDNPWTSYSRLGLEQIAQPLPVLGAVYSIDEPFNPLHNDPALRNRIIIASLQELMMLREHEMPQDHITDYAGIRAFLFARFTQTFPWVVRDCPADVREVLTEGLQRYVDHMAITQVAGVVNQWTFILIGLQHFADGTGVRRDAEMVKRQIGWVLSRNQWNHGRQPAGYFDESEGPDATYNGITNHNLAWLCGQTHDANLLEGLRQCINLFNHTIAPEPAHDGKTAWLGSSSFCHRTPGDWTTPQFGGGMGILSGLLPEAAPHAGRAWLSPRLPHTAEEVQECEKALLGDLKYLDQTAFTDKNFGPNVITAAAEIGFAVWQHCAKTTIKGELPVTTEPRFTRAFGNEFFCVRRPHYYAFIYAGHPMGEWQKQSRPEDAHRQHPRNGGGLCMFWTPMFGSSVLGKNWSAYAAQTLIAESASGKADWEDYWSIQNTFDEQRGEARINGSIRAQPIEFERAYRFLEDRVVCALALHARQSADFKAIWECFPYPLNKPDPMRVTLLDESGNSVSQRPASAIAFQNNSREVHLVVFDQPRRCDVGADHSIDDYQQPHDYGRVLAELPAHWDQGQRRTVKWCIMSVPSDQVAAAVKSARQRLRD